MFQARRLSPWILFFLFKCFHHLLPAEKISMKNAVQKSEFRVKGCMLPTPKHHATEESDSSLKLPGSFFFFPEKTPLTLGLSSLHTQVLDKTAHMFLKFHPIRSHWIPCSIAPQNTTIQWLDSSLSLPFETMPTMVASLNHFNRPRNGLHNHWN